MALKEKHSNVPDEHDVEVEGLLKEATNRSQEHQRKVAQLKGGEKAQQSREEEMRRQMFGTEESARTARNRRKREKRDRKRREEKLAEGKPKKKLTPEQVQKIREKKAQRIQRREQRQRQNLEKYATPEEREAAVKREAAQRLRKRVRKQEKKVEKEAQRQERAKFSGRHTQG